MTTAVRDANFRFADAGAFRAVVAAYLDVLRDMGLVQTDDTGQIDIDTVPMPGAGVIAGYSVWRLDDALQASRPIFLRLSFGAGAAGALRIQMEIGTGTNGEGIITGVLVPARIVGAQPPSSASGRIYGCHSDGFAGVAVSIPAASDPTPGSWWLCRTVDSEGNATEHGIMVGCAGASFSGPSSAYFMCANFGLGGLPQIVVNGTYQPSSGFALIPGGVLTWVNGEMPVYLMFGAFPAIMPMRSVGMVNTAALSPGDTFDVALVGNAPRRYLNPGQGVFGVNSPASLTTCIFWE